MRKRDQHRSMESEPVSEHLPIVDEITRRGITRLCHFTRLSSLRHISHDSWLLSTTELNESNRTFHPTDPERYDRHPTHVCCSVQYPNLRYLRRLIESEPRHAQQWAILLLDPQLMARPNVEFCAVNASERSGTRVASGISAFKSMFDQQVHSYARSGNKSFQRSAQHLPSCPTTIQAEVLIPRGISSESITGVVVRSPTAVPIASALLDSDLTRGIPIQSDQRLFDCHAIEKRICRGKEIHLTTRITGGLNG